MVTGSRTHLVRIIKKPISTPAILVKGKDQAGFKAAKALIRADRKRTGACDWKNPVERASHRREQARVQRRNAVVSIVGQELRCPCCSKSKPRARSWVLLPVKEVVALIQFVGRHPRACFQLSAVLRFAQAGEVAICRGCAMQFPFKRLWGHKRLPAHHRLAKARKSRMM